MIVCAGKNETFSFALPIGVGLVESAINLTRLALFDPPEYLLFIGTAGSYGKCKLFDIIESSTAANVELAFIQKSAYTPIDNVIDASDVSRETKEKVIVNSSNYITTNFNEAQKFRSYGLELENMEFFSVVSVAREFEIPVKGIFIVTNYCNTDAHNDFLKNHEKAKDKLTEYLHKRGWIER
ncbi:MAG: purine-nucleoside phosphorylase [Campylobacteraceae bacterium 4484_4]|nr:MAG: purine-nucleoside phosphorylase [Campylobacteraceae bacterium 4484_4]